MLANKKYSPLPPPNFPSPQMNKKIQIKYITNKTEDHEPCISASETQLQPQNGLQKYANKYYPKSTRQCLYSIKLLLLERSCRKHIQRVGFMILPLCVCMAVMHHLVSCIPRFRSKPALNNGPIFLFSFNILFFITQMVHYCDEINKHRQVQL